MVPTQLPPGQWALIAPASTTVGAATFPLHIRALATALGASRRHLALALRAATASRPTSPQVQITATQWPPPRRATRPPPPATSQSATWRTAACAAVGKRTGRRLSRATELLLP